MLRCRSMPAERNLFHKNLYVKNSPGVQNQLSWAIFQKSSSRSEKLFYTKVTLPILLSCKSSKGFQNSKIKHTQAITRQHPTNCLSKVDQFVRFALKGISWIEEMIIFLEKVTFLPNIFYHEMQISKNVIFQSFSKESAKLKFWSAWWNILLLALSFLIHKPKNYFPTEGNY